MLGTRQPWSSRLLLAFLAATLVFAGSGCEGDKTVEPPPVPTVAILSPAAGDTCSGYVQLSADGENAEVVTFYADTVAVGTDDIAPYEITWNSMTVSNGPLTLQAEAEGIGGVTTDSVDVNVYNLIIVTVTPDSAHVFRGHQQQFHASVEGAMDTTVTWHVDEGKTRGTVTNDGLYTAPDEFMSALSATVRARSATDHTKSAWASITLLPDLHIEAETCFSEGGGYGNVDGAGIGPGPSRCSHASGGYGVDGVDVEGDYIKVPFQLPAALDFSPGLLSARETNAILTYEILFESAIPGAGVWADTLVTLPGSGCC